MTLRTPVRVLVGATLVGLLFPGTVPPAVAAEPSDAERALGRTVEEQLARDDIPGGAVIVVKDRTPVLSEGYGVADVPRRIPFDPERSGVPTASEAKLFTAAAVLQLVEQRRLDLHADVNTYLQRTGFRIDATFPDRPVTLHHLLTHTAGFDEDGEGTATDDPTAVPSLARWVEEHQPARRRPPGEVMAYDNYGFDLAGRIVEIVSGEPYETYVQRHIFDRLGMTRTTAVVPHPAPIRAGMAGGYAPSGHGQVRHRRTYGGSVPSGAGVVTTPGDLGRFMTALLADDPRLGRNVARRMKTQQYAQTPALPGLTYGLQRVPFNGQDVLIKTGDVPGFHHVIALLPARDTAILVTYNGDGPDQAAFGDLFEALGSYLGAQYPVPKSPVQKGIGGDVSRYAGTYRSTRTSAHGLQKFTSLFQSVTVEASGSGELTTTGLGVDPARPQQRWRQIRPGLFAERDGPGRIAFDRRGILVPSMNEATTFERLPWYASPTLHLGIAIVGLTGFVLAFLLVPAIAVVRRGRRRTSHPVGARLARLTAWLAGGLAIAFGLILVPPMLDINQFMATMIFGSGIFLAARIVDLLVAVTMLGVAVFAFLAWRRHWWTIPGRVTYTLFTVAGLGFVAVALNYNLVQLPSW